MALWYVMYFRFYRRRHVFISWGPWTESNTILSLEDFARWWYQLDVRQLQSSVEFIRMWHQGYLVSFAETNRKRCGMRYRHTGPVWDLIEKHVNLTKKNIASIVVKMPLNHATTSSICTDMHKCMPEVTSLSATDKMPIHLSHILLQTA